MGAGVRVGPIGGLAVALGIGAAVFTGHGVASAETPDGSDSSSTSSSSSSESSGSSNTASPDDAPENKETSEVETPETSTDSSDDDDESDIASTTTRKKKRSSDTESSSSRAERSDVSTEASAQTTTSDESPAEDVAPSANEDISPVTETADIVVAEVPEPEPAAATVAEPDPGDPVTVAISSVVSALYNPYADTAPTAPVDSPAEWALLAAARRDFGTARILDTGVGQVTTNSLVTADADPFDPVAELAQSAATVVAIDQPPLLGWVQQVPIVGPLLVTPVVAFIKQIPFIGDILHPIIGYPLGLTGGTTPRDVKVISFDGTPIYVHFFPAPGLEPGHTAPTILNGPGLSLPGKTNPTAVGNPSMPTLLRCCETATTSSPGTLAVNGARAANWRSTRPTSKAAMFRQSSVGCPSSPRPALRLGVIRGSAWSVHRMAAASSW